MTGGRKMTALRRAACAAALAALCLPVGLAQGQRREQSRPAPRQQYRPPRAARPQGRPNVQRGQRPYPNASRPAPAYGASRAPYGNAQRPAPPRYSAPGYPAPGGPRPAYPGYRPPNYAPPGHLQSWLDAHRNVPVANQEQMLRNDPSFRRLPPGEQQRLMRQFNQVHSLNPEQQQRRLARAENLERLSPEQRMQVNRSMRDWMGLATRTPGRDDQRLSRSALRASGPARHRAELGPLPEPVHAPGARHSLQSAHGRALRAAEIAELAESEESAELETANARRSHVIRITFPQAQFAST